jgi:hypothetical protein
MQCCAVLCSAVQCSAVQCSAVQCSAVQCSAVQCSAVQCGHDTHSSGPHAARSASPQAPRRGRSSGVARGSWAGLPGCTPGTGDGPGCRPSGTPAGQGQGSGRERQRWTPTGSVQHTRYWEPPPAAMQQCRLCGPHTCSSISTPQSLCIMPMELPTQGMPGRPWAWQTPPPPLLPGRCLALNSRLGQRCMDRVDSTRSKGWFQTAIVSSACSTSEACVVPCRGRGQPVKDRSNTTSVGGSAGWVPAACRACEARSCPAPAPLPLPPPSSAGRTPAAKLPIWSLWHARTPPQSGR